MADLALLRGNFVYRELPLLLYIIQYLYIIWVAVSSEYYSNKVYISDEQNIATYYKFNYNNSLLRTRNLLNEPINIYLENEMYIY